MPLKLNSGEDLTKRLKRKDVNEMVVHHRNNKPIVKLEFTHFPLTEILALFKSNGVIDFKIPLESQSASIARHGVKLYPGIHFSLETCIGKPRYLNHANIIVCTTKLNDEGNKFIDMLNDDEHFISMASKLEGLDMGQICPPECEDTDDVADD